MLFSLFGDLLLLLLQVSNFSLDLNLRFLILGKLLGDLLGFLLQLFSFLLFIISMFLYDFLCLLQVLGTGSNISLYGNVGGFCKISGTILLHHRDRVHAVDWVIWWLLIEMHALWFLCEFLRHSILLVISPLELLQSLVYLSLLHFKVVLERFHLILLRFLDLLRSWLWWQGLWLA